MQPPFDLGVLVRESLILLIEVEAMAKTALISVCNPRHGRCNSDVWPAAHTRRDTCGAEDCLTGT